MTKYRQITAGEGILLGLTALFLCFLFALNAWDAGHAVRLALAESAAASGLIGSAEPPAVTPEHARGSVDGDAGAGTDAAAAENASAGKLDLNAASVEELETLPGIGPALAERIAEYRAEHGPFPDIDAVTEVSGIGPGKFSAMEPYIFVS